MSYNVGWPAMFYFTGQSKDYNVVRNFAHDTYVFQKILIYIFLLTIKLISLVRVFYPENDF